MKRNTNSLFLIVNISYTILWNQYVLAFNYGAKRNMFQSQRFRSLNSKVWIEKAEDDFVDEDENLMTGEICLASYKAFAQQQLLPEIAEGEDRARAHLTSFTTTARSAQEKRFLGAAALVQRSSKSTICDCWMADTLIDETNVQLKGAILLLDQLFSIHLRNTTWISNRSRDKGNCLISPLYSFVVQCGRPDSEYHSASYMAALNRGFQPLKDLIYFDDEEGRYQHLRSNLTHLDLDDENTDALIFDLSRGIESYTKHASTSEIAREILDMIQLSL